MLRNLKENDKGFIFQMAFMLVMVVVVLILILVIGVDTLILIFILLAVVVIGMVIYRFSRRSSGVV